MVERRNRPLSIRLRSVACLREKISKTMLYWLEGQPPSDFQLHICITDTVFLRLLNHVSSYVFTSLANGYVSAPHIYFQ